MFEENDVLVMVTELKVVLGCAILIGILFLAGYKDFKDELDDLFKK